MNSSVWLKFGIIGLPLIGALVIGRRRGGGPRWARFTRGAAAAILLVAGLAALAMFALNRQYACVLRSGPDNCVFDALASLSICLLGVVLARAILLLRGDNLRVDYALLLLLFTGWAGFGLADNLLQLLIAINVFLIALFQTFKQHDIRWGIFVPWPDHSRDRNRDL